MRALVAAAAAGLSLLAAGCATGPVPQNEPTLENIQLLRRGELPAMAVGDFALEPGRPASMDRVITVRAGTASPPEGKSFAKYLGRTVETELRAAGKLDAASPVVISGLLTQSDVGAGLPDASATLAASFTVTRDGKVVHQKDYKVSQQWQAPFLGAIAIPEAINIYTGLYPKLVGALLADEEFRAAVKP